VAPCPPGSPGKWWLWALILDAAASCRDKLLLYETHRGGMGLAERLSGAFDALLRSAQRIITECPCEVGCLSCVLLGSCYEEGVDKAAAAEILSALLSEE
jgi:DEAD/DEAH box helicase domain-containing protein